MKTDEVLHAALELLEMLSAAPGQHISARHAAEELDIDDSELDRCCELISNLADRSSGARAIVHRVDDDIVLEGEAGRLLPLRLTLSEGIALSCVLADLHIEPDIAERISHALLPPGIAGDQNARVAGTVSFGSCLQMLREAIQDGVRCSMGYRTQGEDAPRVRIVDPHAIETSSDAAYLIAWDIHADAQRRYRLDRIAHVALTDDSVTPHPYRDEDVSSSLAQEGRRVVLSVEHETAESLDWKAVERLDGDPERPGHMLVAVFVTSKQWLFDQVLAQGGRMYIEEPTHMRCELAAYARHLLGSPAAQQGDAPA